MKRARGLVALFTFFTVAFCSITMAFATTVSPTPTLKVYAAVAKTEKAFYNESKLSLGFYPVLTNMPAAFNNKVYNDVWKDNYNYTRQNSENGQQAKNSYKISYEIVEEKTATRYATLNVTCDYSPSRDSKATSAKKVFTYYIDKETNTEISTKADFDKAIEAFLATPSPAK